MVGLRSIAIYIGSIYRQWNQLERVGGEHHFGGVARNDKNDEGLLSDMEHATAVILFFDTTA